MVMLAPIPACRPPARHRHGRHRRCPTSAAQRDRSGFWWHAAAPKDLRADDLDRGGSKRGAVSASRRSSNASSLFSDSVCSVPRMCRARLKAHLHGLAIQPIVKRGNRDRRRLRRAAKRRGSPCRLCRPDPERRRRRKRNSRRSEGLPARAPARPRCRRRSPRARSSWRQPARRKQQAQRTVTAPRRRRIAAQGRCHRIHECFSSGCRLLTR